MILAMNATVEGQTTAHYITDRLADCDVTVSRLAHGVPVGGELDYLGRRDPDRSAAVTPALLIRRSFFSCSISPFDPLPSPPCGGRMTDAVALDVSSLVLGFVFGAGIVLLLRSGVIGKAEAGRLAAEAEFRLRQNDDLGPKPSSGSGSWRRCAPSLAIRRRRRQLQTRLEQERLMSAEKIALLERAEAKLGDAFKALSSEALRSNNQSFLDLARTHVERFQENARGDLQQRQSAISDLVDPVRQSLDRMDGQIQALEKERVGAYEGLKQQVLSRSTASGNCAARRPIWSVPCGRRWRGAAGARSS